MGSEYCVIAGMGRSGTNFVLDLLDLSSTTICRNEPDTITGSQFNNLSHKYDTDSSRIPQDFKKLWTQVVLKERYVFSVRDRKFGNRKDYMVGYWSNSIANWLLSGQRRRNALKWTCPGLSGIRYSLPKFLFDEKRMHGAKLVLKMNMRLGWMLYLVEREPSVPVFHIIRHPGGYFSSMKQRYINKIGEEMAIQGALDRLLSIAEKDEGWKSKFSVFGPLEKMNMVQLSLCWWWCFNETLYEAACGKKSYLSMKFEDMVGDPLNSAKSIYRHIGIKDSLESMVRAEYLSKQSWQSKQQRNAYMNPSKDNIASWRKKLSESEIDIVNQVIKISVFKNWWDNSCAKI